MYDEINKDFFEARRKWLQNERGLNLSKEVRASLRGLYKAALYEGYLKMEYINAVNKRC